MVQIKICGLTSVDEALACAGLGADAIGLVFYYKSPRNLDDELAGEICSALGDEVTKVGVFVDRDYEWMMRKVHYCGLDAVQLHGQESPEIVSRILKEGVRVIKGLFIHREPRLFSAKNYPAGGFLVECGGGKLPGGNAMEWDWGMARDFGLKHPLVLAGGLDPENVNAAITAAAPDAVDVSSGVEFEPGRKDLAKVERFIKAARSCRIERKTRRIF